MLAQAIHKKLGKAVNEEKGFTLIELLAVIVIMGIIAVIAIPMISGLINNTGEKADLATARQIYEASRMYVTTELDGNAGDRTIPVITGTGTAAGTGLQELKFLENPLVLPSTKENIVSGTVNYVDGNLNDSGTGASKVYAITITDDSSPAVVRKYTRDQIINSKLK